MLAWCALALAVAFGPGGCGARVYHVESKYSVDDPQFARTMASLLGPTLMEGNELTTLRNGDEIFPAMLGAIRDAKTTIDMETYVYWTGRTGETFTAALVERACAGVRVNVIIDAVGSASINFKYLRRLHEAGAKVVLYHPLAWFDALNSARKLNNRTHRKLLIVDGTLGFIGGVGIADEWSGHAQDKDHWRDNHYMVRGPVVGQLQGAFMDNWMESTGEVLHDGDYFPALQTVGPAGCCRAQLFKSSYRGGNHNMRLMYLLSFAGARRSIRLGTPYMLLDDIVEQGLIEARKRGVDVRIILPGPVMDEKLEQRVSRATYGDLLEAGVRIFEYQPTMFHCKMMVVDDLWTSIGSSNMDPRSFGLNCEANLNVLDAAFAQEQARIFDEDLSHCKEVTYEAWKARSIWDRMFEPVETPLGPQM
jgi:cardiolipin synthase